MRAVLDTAQLLLLYQIRLQVGERMTLESWKRVAALIAATGADQTQSGR